MRVKDKERRINVGGIKLESLKSHRLLRLILDVEVICKSYRRDSIMGILV